MLNGGAHLMALLLVMRAEEEGLVKNASNVFLALLHLTCRERGA